MDNCWFYATIAVPALRYECEKWTDVKQYEKELAQQRRNVWKLSWSVYVVVGS